MASLAVPTSETDTHAVTFQRFPISDPEVSDLSVAMSQFKANHTDKIKDAYLGVLPGLLAEQVFVWHSPEDSNMDFTTPFLSFSSTGALNASATGLLPNETSIYESLHCSLMTETLIQDVFPDVNRTEFQEVSDALCVKINEYSGSLGCSIGDEYNGNRRIVLIGWQSTTAAVNWYPSADNETVELFAVVQKDVDGVLERTYLNLNQVA
ncbi:hypothetical protein V5O48_006042 [Marasmius crinis-equi]|uniref:RES domain-containing protein n=1 Tax=Marasmius crinis-equi TaxID=585013 RepID=A0ABR3FKL4_9AGAR